MAKTFTLDGKRMKLNALVPAGQIEWIAGRWHVSMTDEEIRTEIAKRSAGKEMPENVLRSAQAYAIACHRKNQALYRFVATGFAGRARGRGGR